MPQLYIFRYIRMPHIHQQPCANISTSQWNSFSILNVLVTHLMPRMLDDGYSCKNGNNKIMNIRCIDNQKTFTLKYLQQQECYAKICKYVGSESDKQCKHALHYITGEFISQRVHNYLKYNQILINIYRIWFSFNIFKNTIYCRMILSQLRFIFRQNRLKLSKTQKIGRNVKILKHMNLPHKRPIVKNFFHTKTLGIKDKNSAYFIEIKTSNVYLITNTTDLVDVKRHMTSLMCNYK